MLRKKFTPERKKIMITSTLVTVCSKEKKKKTLTLPLKSICQNETNIKLLDCQEFHIISLSKTG